MGAGEREEGEEPAIQAMFTYVRGKTKFENKSSLQCSVSWPTLKNNNLQQQQWKLILANVASGPSAQLIYANNSSRLSQRPGSPGYCTATESVNLLDEMESWAFLFCSLKLSPLFLKGQYFFLIIVQCPQHFYTFFIIDKTIITETTKNDLKHFFYTFYILQNIWTWLNDWIYINPFYEKDAM